MEKKDKVKAYQIKISVRNLVEFLLRSGDIDHRSMGRTEGAMQEGARIHRSIQRRMGSEYEAEVSLRYREDTARYQLIVEGRADGIITLSQKEVTIDEIKGTYKSLERIEEPEPVHLAQARVYAFIYAGEKGLQHIGVRMTYCNLETEEIKYFHYDYTMKELKDWFEELIGAYKRWADFKIDWREKRQESIKGISFPFLYRPGQKELAAGVYRTIFHKRKLFLEAPTGVGKTISTIFPSVKALGEGLGERIFYFTAKTITRTVAEETFKILRKQSLRFKTITLTAKEKICFQEEVKCNPIDCPYAKGHFDRINDALYEMLINNDAFTKEIIERYAMKYQVCPFELALDGSLFSDGIIGDYNYLFDPHVYLKRFFGEGMDQEGIFLIDEAHNLVERGREMYSAAVIKEDFLALKKRIRPYSEKMEKRLSRCNRELLLYKKEASGLKKRNAIDSFILSLERLYKTMSDYLENHNDGNVRDEVLDLFFKIRHFLMIYDKLNDNYVIYSRVEETGNFKLKLYCMDPAPFLKDCMAKGKSSILFSATLLPIQYYKKLLGGTEEDYEIYAASPFSSENRFLGIAQDVTSKYSRRGDNEYKKIADYIRLAVEEKRGNYLVFLPSYDMMQQVGKIFLTYYGREVNCIFQKEFMKEEEREDFLKLFEQEFTLNREEINFRKVSSEQWSTNENENTKKSLVGFCVMGGIFSEGIDLKKDSLIGVIVVGTGFPQICPERELLKEYYQNTLGKGFDYAYRYPGMNKVLQAAGRVIRTSEDRGVILLLEERFLDNSYKALFPREWKDYMVIRTENVKNRIANFWKQW